jgi:hypothetical protein
VQCLVVSPRGGISAESFVFNVPSQYRDGVVDPVKKRRRSEWLRAMSQTTELNDAYVKDMKVCSKHFNTGEWKPLQLNSLTL